MLLNRLAAILTLALLAFDPRAGSCANPVRFNSGFSGQYTLLQMPEPLTYDELVELGTVDAVRRPLREKLDTVLTVPFISNGAYYNGTRPLRPSLPGLGPSLRVVMWNIDRGLRLEDIKALFSNRVEFLRRIDPSEVSPESDKYKQMLEQVEVLQSADVLVLQELDWGIKRARYREVARELGEALKMNWAYGVEFVETRSANGLKGTLANSNERASKGFAATYEVERSFGPIGKLKLDWIFVKPYVNGPRIDESHYRFAPHRGRTLEEVNYSVKGRISDHNPISVDLPFDEPAAQNSDQSTSLVFR